MRLTVGLTQQGLAALVGTSQSAIAAYESGRKSPTLRTLEKMANSLDLELVTSFSPRMTREDSRSLALHTAIAEQVKEAPELVVTCARQNLNRLWKMHPHARQILARWRDWLTLPTPELVSCMLDPGLAARDMRQVSPFSGVLNPGQRNQVLKAFRSQYNS